MDRVVVGLDGSTAATAALRWAVTVGEQAGWPVRALWAWTYPATAILPVGPSQLPSPEEVERTLGEQGRTLLAETLGERARIVTLQVARGPAAAVLLRTVQDGARMVVVGSRGLGGFEGVLLGSVSRHVAEHATCPVTVVHGGLPDVPDRLERIVVGVDGSEGAQRALRFAGDVAVKTGADLLVASAASPGDLVQREHDLPHVDLEVQRELLWSWTAPVREAGIEHDIVALEGDARIVLPDLAAERSADLLIVGSRGLGPVGKLLLGSVAASLIRYADMPVTIVPSPH